MQCVLYTILVCYQQYGNLSRYKNISVKPPYVWYLVITLFTDSFANNNNHQFISEKENHYIDTDPKSILISNLLKILYTFKQFYYISISFHSILLLNFQFIFYHSINLSLPFYSRPLFTPMNPGSLTFHLVWRGRKRSGAHELLETAHDSSAGATHALTRCALAWGGKVKKGHKVIRSSRWRFHDMFNRCELFGADCCFFCIYLSIFGIC